MSLNRQPLYLQIAYTLQREIPLRFPPGALLDPDALAERFNVSALTLREALSVLVRQGFIERHKGRGTFVRQDAPLPHVAIVSELDLFDAGVSFFYRRLMQVLRTVFRQRQVRVRLYIGHTRPAEPAPRLTCDDLEDDLEHGQIRGLVAVAVDLPPELRDLARRHGVPVIAASSGSDGCLLLDHAGLVRSACADFAAADRRQVAVLGRPGLSAADLERLLAEHGLRTRPEWCQQAIHSSLPGAGWDNFLAAWGAAATKPDGLLIADDMLFDDAAAAMVSAGVRVPEELLVITHANRGARARYPVPAIRYELDVDATAQTMADMALRLMGAEAGAHEQAVIRFARTEPTGPWRAARPENAGKARRVR